LKFSKLWRIRTEVLRLESIEFLSVVLSGYAAMVNVFEIVFVQIWWTYEAEEPFGFSACYHWFNILEGQVWLVFSALVLLRFLRHRQSRIEVWYCLLFAAFGVSDLVEAWQQSSWLIWLKLFNLYGLVRTREHVMRRHYPAARLY
jgi:hypothetical protein